MILCLSFCLIFFKTEKSTLFLTNFKRVTTNLKT